MRWLPNVHHLTLDDYARGVLKSFIRKTASSPAPCSTMRDMQVVIIYHKDHYPKGDKYSSIKPFPRPLQLREREKEILSCMLPPWDGLPHALELDLSPLKALSSSFLLPHSTPIRHRLPVLHTLHYLLNFIAYLDIFYLFLWETDLGIERSIAGKSPSYNLFYFW